MPDRKVDDALIRRVAAAAHRAGVSRAEVELEWPECHKPRCQHRHGSPEIAMGYMAHQIIEAIELELRYESTTRPDIAEPDDSPEEAAIYALAVLMNTYNVRHAGTFARAARMIIEAYPALIPALAGKS